MPETLLIIEDEKLLGSELQRHYRGLDYEVVWAQTYADAENKLVTGSIDPLVILSDLNLPDGNGLDLLESFTHRLPGSEWVFLTGYGDVPDSVRALQLGAFDFLTKPCPQQQLDMTVHSALRSARAQRRVLNEISDASEQFAVERFLGSSVIARETQQMLRQLSQVPYSALILTGETGTGKGLAARILHYNSERAAQPMVELNCSALPREMLESELFGHEAGAFTGAKGRHRGLMEQAQGGTLFLDEIGEMPLDLQAKLLKVVEDRRVRRLGGEREISVDIQIIAATNRNLQDEIREGRFRSDLYHRLSVFELRLPSLRERIDDLHDLVPTFVAEFNLKAGKKVSQISDQARQNMAAYGWPGNVRELRNVIERCVILSTSNQLPEQWLQLRADELSSTVDSDSSTSSAALSPTLSNSDSHLGLRFPTDGGMGLDDMVAEIIRAMLKRYDGNVTEVARVLKTTREKVRYRIEKYNIR